YHDDVLAGCDDGHVARDRVARAAAILLLQEVHREVDAAELAARNREVPRDARAAAEADGIVVTSELFTGNVHTDVDTGLEGHTLFGHLLDPSLDEPLLHLEVGNAVGEQPAEPIVSLEHGHVVTRPR